MLRAGSTGIISFNLGNNGWNELTTNSNAVSLDVWHHVAATYDGSTMKIYVDGVMVASMFDPNINFSSDNQNLMIGSWSNIGRHLHGSVDEVRVWNITRTAAQIQHYMNCELPNPLTESGLVAYYRFNQGTDAGDNTAFTNVVNDSPTGNIAFLNNFNLNGGTTSNYFAGSSVVTGNTCTVLSSDDFESDFEKVKVYPNPSSGIFQLQIQEEVQLEVYDLMGKMVLHKNVPTGIASFDLSQHAAGIYLLKVTNASGDTSFSKIVKE